MSDYAPNPEAQDIYKGLAQQKLGDVEPSVIANLTDPVFIQAKNQNDLISMNIINESVFRSDGGPLPNKGKVVQTSGSGDRIQFQPQRGEVWKLNGGDILETGTSTFTVGFQLRDLDGNIAFIGTSSSTGQEPITVDSFFEGEIFITNSLYLYIDVQAGEGRVSTALIQIR